MPCCVQDMVTVGKVHEGNGRDLGMTLFGIAGLTLFDKFYEEGGIEGCMFWAVGGEAEGGVAGAGGAYKLFGCWTPPDVRVSSPTGKAIYTFVTIWALMWSALFWVGLFNVVDDFVPPAILNSVRSHTSDGLIWRVKSVTAAGQFINIQGCRCGPTSSSSS
eukprot:COSAG01_NODE_4228_length_5224_cov_2.652488_6_plen_161_part_00